jgi:hypothetical protein
LKLIWLGLAFGIAGLTGFYSGEHSVAVSAQQALFVDGPFTPALRTKIQTCVINGSYPDGSCTPGAVFPDVTAQQTCVSGYTKTVRNVSTSLKKQVYREYGLAYPPPYGSYEADHFIPLTLGGSNDIANLFPEAASPIPGFHQKDIVENYLHEQVCAGKVSLTAAQRAIATDWVAVYNSIPQTEIDRLKQEFKSWSQSGD